MVKKDKEALTSHAMRKRERGREKQQDLEKVS